jgi:predicted nucleic acid-binding protein
MNIFLDANILVSVLNKEYPLFAYSSRIVSLADNNRFRVYTSPICLAIAFYFSEKKSGRQSARKKIKILTGKIQIAPVDKTVVHEDFK